MPSSLKKMKLKMFVKDIPCLFLLSISVFSSEEGPEVIQWQFWDSSAFTSFCCNAVLGADGQWASPCCFRVVGFFEPAFTSALGRVYFGHFEIDHFHLGD